MGTTGSGSFHDYPGGKTSHSAGGTPGGDEPSMDECSKPVAAALEEVATQAYVQANADVPRAGTDVVLKQQLAGGRLVVATSDGTFIGFLPSRYSYLFACMKRGYKYAGAVESSSMRPLPRITVTLAS